MSDAHVELAHLERIAARPAETAILMDFDGTLSPIVDDPDAAAALPGASEVLEALASRFALVAIVSGRPVEALRARLGTPARVRLVGLYGAEHLVDGEVRALGAELGDRREREARALGDRVEDAARALEQALQHLDGVAIERKGLSVAVHFRRAPDPIRARAEAEPVINDVAARARIGEVRPGRMVLEIGPAAAVDKGTAARALLHDGITAALAAGDDLGDVEIFRALDVLPTKLRIAVLSAETPRSLLDAADATVSGPAELLNVLSALARATGL